MEKKLFSCTDWSLKSYKWSGNRNRLSLYTYYFQSEEGGGEQLLEELLVWNYGLGGAYLFGGGHLLEHGHLFKEIW